jgi:hypothetical protein
MHGAVGKILPRQALLERCVAWGTNAWRGLLDGRIAVNGERRNRAVLKTSGLQPDAAGMISQGASAVSKEGDSN